MSVVSIFFDTEAGGNTESPFIESLGIDREVLEDEEKE